MITSQQEVIMLKSTNKQNMRTLGEASLRKKRENLGKIPKRGGGEKQNENFPISIWEIGKPREDLNFSKMSELKITLRHNPK